MINNVLSEKDYQKFILERLSEQGYTIKPATNYDRLFAVDRKTLFEFLERKAFGLCSCIENYEKFSKHYPT